MTRGFFEIGIYRGKTPENVGTLWRSAYQLGAHGIFTVGKRYDRQTTDTANTTHHIPCRDYANYDALLAALPQDTELVAVEMGGEDLTSFRHPPRAIYLLGSEDFGLPKEVVRRCHRVINLPSIRTASYNVAVAGSLVMFDRATKNKSFLPPPAR